MDLSGPGIDVKLKEKERRRRRCEKLFCRVTYGALLEMLFASQL